MGRPKGSKNKPRLHLTSESAGAEEKPSPAQRMKALKRQVVLMVADKMSPEKISAVMGFDVDKLKAVFAHELEHGREIIRTELLLRFDAAGDGGSVPANRSLEAITSLPGLGDAPTKVGKKATASAAAAAAAAPGQSIYSPPLLSRAVTAPPVSKKPN